MLSTPEILDRLLEGDIAPWERDRLVELRKQAIDGVISVEDERFVHSAYVRKIAEPPTVSSPPKTSRIPRLPSSERGQTTTPT
jgi:hypothetical protein